MNEVNEREIMVNREYRNGGQEFVTMQRADTKADVARTLISQGLMLIDERKDKRFQSVVSRRTYFALYSYQKKKIQ